MKIKYVINLTTEEQRELEQITSKGKAPVRRINRNQILLHAVEDEIDKSVAQALHMASATVFRARRRFVE